MDPTSVAHLAIFIVSLLYYIFIYKPANLIAQATRRNIKPVTLPNMFLVILKKQRYELHKHKVIRREGRILGCQMMGKYTIVIAEPELAGQVLSKQYTNFPDRREFFISDPAFTENLIFAKAEKWKRLRSIVTPTFSTGKIKQMKPCIDETVKKLLENIESKGDQQIINAKEFFSSFTMDTIARIGFGVIIDSLNDPNHPIPLFSKKMFSIDVTLKNLFSVTVIIALPKIAQLLGLRFNAEPIDFFSKLVKKIIVEKKAEIAKKKEETGHFKANTFIELILEADETEDLPIIDGKPSKYMTTDEIVSMCVLFLLAGYDTTASTISITAFNLATNPLIQDRVYEEITSILEKLEKDSPEKEKDPYKLITLEFLSKFEFLTACINESLRMFGPSIMTERTAAKDVTLVDGKTEIEVKEGDIVHVDTYALHHDPNQFPNPEQFQPERFLGEPTHHKYAFIPFSAGPKNCVARSLALMEVKLCLIHVLRNYRFKVCEQTKIPCEFYNQGNILIPKDVMVKIEKR